MLKKAHENQEKIMKKVTLFKNAPCIRCLKNKTFLWFLKNALKTHGNGEENIHAMHWSAGNAFIIGH